MTSTHRTVTRWPSGKSFFLAITVWTLLVLASLMTQRDRIEETAFSLAKTDAVANLTKDMAIRQWASNVGGVYIREEFVPPFNSLQEEQRLTVRPNNAEPFKLVKVTPMHLLLAIQQTSNEEFGIHERLTSNQLRNIENMPDPWEVQALDVLNEGAELVAEAIPGKRGHGLMRVMIPMRMDDECLECHRDTLVPVGGLRGGAAISVDLNAYRAAQEPIWRSTQYWHFSIWLLGSFGLLIFHLFIKRRAAELLREEEMQRENDAAFSAMAEGAMITDADGNILWANDAFCRISGYSREDIAHQNLGLFMSGVHGWEFYQSIRKQLAEKGHWRGEIWNRKKTGEVFPEEMSVQSLRDAKGRIRRYISVFSDISERKKTEKELTKYREHLEDLVRKRTEELTDARNQAEAANRSKSAFLANMNHELRTPLNAVIGFAQLMEKDSALTSKQQFNAEIIGASGRHLLTLINDILELSKIESGKMEMRPETIMLIDLLEQVVGMMRLRAEQAGISLRLETIALPPAVSLDPAMLRQVLLNLLSNAIKFAPGGKVALRVKGYNASEDGDNIHLAFSVSDDGVGISVEDQKRIFSPFEQAGPMHQGGTGLGLTISRQYVQMMGGELHVASKSGEGATFYFDVPVQISQEFSRPQQAPEVSGLPAEEQGQHILVVDDIPEARLLVHSLLEPLGFTISEAAGMAAAEAAIAAATPDLVLIDWFLSDGSGIEFLRRVRADTRISQPKLVMFTANALEENRQRALEAGADDFLSKPFQKDELYRILEQQLGVHFIRARTTSVSYPLLPEKAQKVMTALQNLSQEMREDIIQAAVSLSPEQIDQALERVASVDHELAGHLREVCAGRQYRALWQLLGILEKGE